MSTTRRNDAPSRSARGGLSELVDRQLPCDLDAETNLLGSVILLPDVLDDVIQIVKSDDFFDDGHGKLYAHLCELHEASKRIDLTILSDRLKSTGDFETIGGAAYLSKII